jgi:hypothetical protein
MNDPRLLQAAHYIKLAQEGDTRAARELFGLLGEYMMDDAPIPEPLKGYFIPRCWNTAKDENPLELFHFKQKGSGRPKERLTPGWDVVRAVFTVIEEYDLPTFEAAFAKLYEENFYALDENSKSMPEEQIQKLFYKSKDSYEEHFGLPERIKNMGKEKTKKL